MPIILEALQCFTSTTQQSTIVSLAKTDFTSFYCPIVRPYVEINVVQLGVCSSLQLPTLELYDGLGKLMNKEARSIASFREKRLLLMINRRRYRST